MKKDKALLAINIGNTNINLLHLLAEESSFYRYRAQELQTPENYIEILKDIIHGDEDFVIASVVPNKTRIVSKAITELTGKSPLIITADMIDIDRHLYQSEIIGIDRLLAGHYAFLQFHKPLIIYDFGSASTISVMDKQGCFRGGAIMPGLEMGMTALADNTAQLPKVKLEKIHSVIGSNTNECILSGAIMGAVAYVETMSKKIEAELGDKCLVILTGGNSEYIYSHIERKVIYHPNLTLESMINIYQEKAENE